MFTHPENKSGFSFGFHLRGPLPAGRPTRGRPARIVIVIIIIITVIIIIVSISEETFVDGGETRFVRSSFIMLF